MGILSFFVKWMYREPHDAHECEEDVNYFLTSNVFCGCVLAISARIVPSKRSAGSLSILQLCIYSSNNKLVTQIFPLYCFYFKTQIIYSIVSRSVSIHYWLYRPCTTECRQLQVKYVTLIMKSGYALQN